MNQQRGRRFRSAREADKLEERAREKGEVLPKEKRFDSNCITPGTVFMARLHEQLKYFVKHKMSTDPLWAKVRVILSGHETPGEGEHKIMDYIRWARSQPEYDPNTRHCLYGLDADLIMLGMCTHEPHFALLREEVKFGKTTQRVTCPEETNFYLLHLSLLRQYLEQEFILIKDVLPFEYDLEKIVDDWVLMGFLVGNDFIPNLPNMHISNDALPLLYKTYMTVLPTLDGYINESGELNLGRFEIFMQELAKIDKEKFQDTYLDMKYFESKTGRRMNANERKEYKPNNDETFNVNIEDIKANKPDDELQALINATDDMLLDDADSDGVYESETSDDEANFNMEFILHKKDYYMNKLDYSKVTDEVLASQAEGYVRAIQWNLYYYYRGCPSWCWFYPHHYAPYMSDIKGFKDLKIEFELGEPFKPFEQLLAVLPAASKHLLPSPFHELMTDEESPIIDYYPVNFDTDLNGKKNDWEAVVLIPFIEEDNLLAAMIPCYQRLTDEERRRNSFGPMLVYNWTNENLGAIPAPEYFPPIKECHAIEKQIWREELDVPLKQLKSGMLPNARRDLLFPGFPTMRHLKYKTQLKKCKVKVFDQPSRNENMIIQLIKEKEDTPSIDEVAQNFLGKTIWVGWPHLTRAKVISVSNEKMRLHHTGTQSDGVASLSTEQNTGNLLSQWRSERATIIDHNMNRLGIELGDVNIIIHATNLRGYKYLINNNSQVAVEPEWCTVPCGYALQAVVKDVHAHIAAVATRYSTPEEAFPPGDKVFLITQGPYYGCMAKVIDSDGVSRSGRIRVQVHERPEPTASAHAYVPPYKSAHHAAAACGITPQMLSRITGSVFVVPGARREMPTDAMSKINIGLNLKFNKKNQEVSGYTRRCSFTNSWMYSERCVNLVSEYVAHYPQLFDALARSLDRDVFFESDLWPEAMGEKKAQDVALWLSQQPHSTAVRRECGSEALEPEEMKQLAQSIDTQNENFINQDKNIALQVKLNLLYKPDLHEGNISPDPKADFQIYDRVVCVANNMTVPLGAKGTVTAIYQPSATNTVRLSDKLNSEPTYQVLFDEPFPGGMQEELFDTPRFYRLFSTCLLNISYGRRLRSAAARSAPIGEAAATRRAPNLLKRDHDHHSAFANYSPTKDRTSVTDNNCNANSPITAASTSAQDGSTELLKSLLKISMPNPTQTTPSKTNVEMEKVANQQMANQQSDNWRTKNDNTQQTATPQRPQPANWRKENQQSRPVQNEWTNNNFKNTPMPIPPFPNFNQTPFSRGPVANQIPFPQFQQHKFPPNPNFNPNNSYQNSINQNPHFNRTPYNPNLGQVYNQKSYSTQLNRTVPPKNNVHEKRDGFPQHLPPVKHNIPTVSVPSSSWPIDKTVRNQECNTGVQIPHSAPEKCINNPFVPLQVQTSQRRVQTTSESYSVENKEIAAPLPVQPPPAPAQTQPPQDNAETTNTSRVQKKRRHRLAANLPFREN
ncbi:5'-3' exoribonuclease 1 [Eumeta japonica]|uniref:5'-3' exoribonuclease 1 n=1 Tax=Eumeta variegata TaxID=151549 RepID=A0A4C1UNF2_EUMVA|nr:5'-3' exoribonuclease 1 [Eumeta japonica]